MLPSNRSLQSKSDEDLKAWAQTAKQTLESRMSNLQPIGHMHPRIAMKVAPCNLQTNIKHCEVFALLCFVFQLNYMVPIHELCR